MSASCPNKSRGCGEVYAPPISSTRENGGAPAQKERQGSPPWTRLCADEFRLIVSSIPRLFRLRAGDVAESDVVSGCVSAQAAKTYERRLVRSLDCARDDSS